MNCTEGGESTITIRRYVIDTCVLINYFGVLFGEATKLSSHVRRLLDRAFAGDPSVLISIPAVVLVEIFEKWFRDEEFCRQFQYEVFLPLKALSNVEIRPIDRELMTTLLTLDADMGPADLHDRIVLASAMVLQCPLLTYDGALTDYVANRKPIPAVLS